MNPTPTQEEIINYKGNLVVNASAGTGKTYTLVQKIIKETEIENTHRVIAAITFTIKAANEIKERLKTANHYHFVGTNNTFVIEEIIKPFMKDYYGLEYDINLDTDYQEKFESYDQGLQLITAKKLLGSYVNNFSNFVFQLALNIIKNSIACQRYMKAKYRKIYIDEYQDCDIDMHTLFMYLCDELKIETFVVGDEKQSIYMWRGANPELFTSIKDKDNFESIFMSNNFRSCKAIQNYSNLLCAETMHLYSEINKNDEIIWIKTDASKTWQHEIIQYLDLTKSIALLRFSNANAEQGAEELKNQDLDFVYIPRLTISEITTNSAWVYYAIASYCIIDNYSEYDFISSIPVEGEIKNSQIKPIKTYLEKIDAKLISGNKDEFSDAVMGFFKFLDYEMRDEHCEMLFNTIQDSSKHVSFYSDRFKHIAITFHSSKGLEFDQVIIFAEDYRLNSNSDIYNHYVAATRAKSRLIIIRNDNYNANKFTENLSNIYKQSNVKMNVLISLK